MGVFDILPGLGGDDEAGTAESADDSGDAGGSAGDQASLAGLEPGDFRERAAALTERSDVPTLDFTVESLESLDGLAAGPPSAVDDRVAYGSYLGETIVREFGGEWTDEGDWQVAVELSDDRTTIAVFDAAEMSIAEEPVFAKVVEHLEAQGAERTPTAPDDPVTDAGVETGDADDGPSGGSGDQHGTGAGGDTEPSGRGEADDAATFGIGEDDAEDPTEPDTVVVDEPVTDTVGQPADASSAGDGQPADADSVGDGATATADATVDEVDSDEPGTAGVDGTDDDAPSTSAPFVPDSADSSGSAGDDDRSEPDRTDDETAADVDRDDSPAESGGDETDSEDETGGGSGLLSSSVLPFGGGGDDADDASDATGDADDGVTEDESTSGTDGDAPTADRDDEDPVSTHADGSDASATGSSAAVTDASDDATDASDGTINASDDTGSSGDEGGDGNADASVDDASVDDDSENDDFAPDSSGGYSTTDFSSGDYSLGTDEDDESTAGADSDGATTDADDTGVAADGARTDAEPTKSISEQIEDIRNDVGPSADGDADGSADGDGDAAGPGDADDGSTTRASPLESGPAVDETAAGVGDGDAVDDGADTADDGADATGGRPAAPERYVLRKAAEDLADGWPERDLDFTPASLPRLDTFVDQQWDGRFRASSLENRTVHHEERGDPLVQLGAYYAEVLIRALDGEWVATDDSEGAIEVPDVGERTERVDVFAVARECLVPPSTFAYRYDALVNGLHADEPAVSDGRAHVFDDDRATLTSGNVITQFAATAEDVVEEWEKYPLDYSPRSVRALDEIVDWLTEDVDLTDVPLSEGTDPESLWLTARATSLGAYYAAVLLRHRDAQWQIDGDDVELVIDRPDGERTVDPVATAADTLRGDGSFVDTYAALDD